MHFNIQKRRMPRLQNIGGFVITAIAIILAILSEIVDRQEAVKTDTEFAALRKTFSEVCSSIEIQQGNQITRNPCVVVAAKSQLPREKLQPSRTRSPESLNSRRIPENCKPDQITLEVDAEIAALFEIHDGSSTCIRSTRKPASVLVSLITTDKSARNTSASTKRTSLETGSQKL
jgi:hypothetical protein